MASGPSARLGNRLGFGDAALALEQAPAAAQRRRGDVEGAVGGRAEVIAAPEQRAQLVVELAGLVDRPAVDLAEVAVLAKDRPGLLQAIGMLESLPGGSHVGGGGGGQQNLEAAGHSLTKNAQKGA